MFKNKLIAAAMTFTLIALYGATAFAQGGDAPDNIFTTYGMFALAAGLAIGVAGAGAALGQGRAAAAALEGIALNPGSADKLQTPLLLSLAFMEALGIFAFVIAFLIQLKLDITVLPK